MVGHRRPSEDERHRSRTATQRLTSSTIAAVFAALALPVVFRIDVGFSPAETPGRRALALGITAVIAACSLHSGAWLRRLVGLLAVVGLAALGMRSVALTLLLALTLVELTVRHLGRTGNRPEDVGNESLGLTLVSIVIAVSERPVSAVPGTTVQLAAICFVLAAPTGLRRLGRWASDTAQALMERRRNSAGIVPDPGGASPAPATGVPRQLILAVPVLMVLALPSIARRPSSADLLAGQFALVAISGAALLLTAAFLAARPRVRWVTYGMTIALLELAGWRTLAVSTTLSILIIEAARPVIAGVVPASSRNDRRSDRGAVGALAGLSVLFAVVGWTISTPVQLIVMAIVATVLWVRPVLLTRFAALVRAVASGVAATILRILTLAVWLVFVLVPWSIERVAGWDPTFARRPPGTRLVPRHVGWTDDRRSWIPNTSLLRSQRAGRAMARLVGAGVALVLLWFLVATRIGVPLYWSTRMPQTLPAAMVESPWWAEAIPAEMAAFERGQASAFTGIDLADVRSEFTNVVDGHRVTWRPPAPPVATVWFFGGSTVFGLGQRDDHTIPSEFAQAAWAAGLPVDVVNFGVHGDVHWMEANRLREALASGLPPPDLVVFYDGWNDLKSHVGTDTSGSWQEFRGTLDPLLADQRIQGSWFSDLFTPDNFTIAPLRVGEEATPEQVLNRGITQYRDSVADTLAFTASRNLTTFCFIQPMLVTREQPVPGEPSTSVELATAAAALVQSRPDGVIDLTASFDELETPVYWDDGHTNELGARVVAAEILSAVEPSLREAAGS